MSHEGLESEYRALKNVVSILRETNREYARATREKAAITAALRESEEKYRSLVENANDGITIIQDGLIKFVNLLLSEMTGYSSKSLTNSHFVNYVHPDERVKVAETHRRRMAGEKAPSRYESALVHRNGTKIDVEFNAALVMYEDRPAAIAIIRDITERKQAEAALRTAYDQSTVYARELKKQMQRYRRTEEEKKKLESRLLHAQKMQSIGTLAGSIAHDFNNVLMGIQGYASLIMNDLDETHPHYHLLRRLEDHVNSGAGFTRQLLGFARGGKYDVRPTNLNEIAEKSSSMFGRTKKEITVKARYGQDLWPVEVDQG